MSHIRSSLTLAAAIVVMVAATGCTTPRIRSQVTSFSQPTLLDQQPKTFKFDVRPGQADSLEHETYTHLVADQLLILGYTQDPNGRLSVSFDDSLQAQEVMIQSGFPYGDFGSAAYGGYGGYGYGGFYGRGGRGRYWGGGGWGPWGGGGYGWGGPYGGFGGGTAYLQTVARAQFKLDIRVAATGAKAFEGTVSYGGTIDDMTVLMPYLVQSMFTDFPGLNGQTRRIVIPMQQE